MKEYELNGLTYLFPEGGQPAGAVEVKPKTKAVKPANKGVSPKNKAVSDVDSKSDAVESGGSRSGKARRG